MDVKIPAEDFIALKQHIDDGVRDSLDFMNKLACKSKKCTQKAYDNVAFMVFSHILYKEIKVLFDLIESIQVFDDMGFPHLPFLPLVSCHQFDGDIQIRCYLDLKLFVVHIIHQIVLEYTDFMKIMYLENYDYENQFTATFIERISNAKLADGIVRVLTFIEHDFDGIDIIRIDHLMTCMEINKKNNMDMHLVFNKLNNMISSTSNLQSFLIDIYRALRIVRKSSPSVMFARMRISEGVELEEDGN